MALHYLSPGLGTGANDGSTTDNAWHDWATAAAATITAGDTLLVNADEASTATVTITNKWNGVIVEGCATNWTRDGTIRYRNGTGSGSTIDGITFNTVAASTVYPVIFRNIGVKNYGRHGINCVTGISSIQFENFDSSNNANAGYVLYVSGTVYIGGSMNNCKAGTNGTYGVFGYNGRLCNCEINNSGTHGFYQAAVNVFLLKNCIIRNSGTDGVYLVNNAVVYLIDCVIDTNLIGITGGGSGAGCIALNCILSNNATNSMKTIVVYEINQYNYNNGVRSGMAFDYQYNTTDGTTNPFVGTSDFRYTAQYPNRKPATRIGLTTGALVSGVFNNEASGIQGAEILSAILGGHMTRRE
jgi:hypothetical protein